MFKSTYKFIKTSITTVNENEVILDRVIHIFTVRVEKRKSKRTKRKKLEEEVDQEGAEKEVKP